MAATNPMDQFLANADFFTRQVLLAAAFYDGQLPPATDTSGAAELLRLATQVLGKPIPDLTDFFLDGFQGDMFDRDARERRLQVAELGKDLKLAVHRLPEAEKKNVITQLASLSRSPEVMKQLDTGTTPTVTLTRGEATVVGATADIRQPVSVEVDTVKVPHVNKVGGRQVFPGGGKTRI